MVTIEQLRKADAKSKGFYALSFRIRNSLKSALWDLKQVQMIDRTLEAREEKKQDSYEESLLKSRKEAQARIENDLLIMRQAIHGIKPKIDALADILRI